MHFCGHLKFYLKIGLILLVRQVAAQNECDVYEGIGEAVTISSDCFSNGTVHYSWTSDQSVDFLHLDYSCSGPDASQFDPEIPPIPWGDGTFLQGVSVASIPNWDNGWSCSFFGCYEIESRGRYNFSIVETPCTIAVAESSTLPMMTSTQVPSPSPTAKAENTARELTGLYITVALVVAVAAIGTLTVIITLISCLTHKKRRHVHGHDVQQVFADDKPGTDTQQFDIDTKLSPAKSEQSVFDPLHNINDLLMVYNQSPSSLKGGNRLTHVGPPSIPLSRDTPVAAGSLSIIPEAESDTSTVSIANQTRGKPNSHFLEATLDLDNCKLSGTNENEELENNPENNDRCLERAELKTETGTPPSGSDDPGDLQSVEYNTESTGVERSFEVPLKCYDIQKDSSGLSVASGYIQLTHASQFTHSLPLNGKNTSADTNTPPFNIGLASESDIDNLATLELQSHETEFQK